MSRFARTSLVAALAVLSWTSVASGSTLVARNAANMRLAVNTSGHKALLTYNVNGVTKHVLVSGAVNALAPDPATPQVQFTIDYTGGGRSVWHNFRNRCTRYDGPALAFSVLACKAPDGSYWAVQRWQYWLPSFGYSPWLAYQSDWAFHVSHWTGPLAVLDLWTDWVYTAQKAKAPHNLFGRLTYLGKPVYGFKVGNGGQPQDGYGRVVHFETLDSPLGRGWWRLTGILSRNPSGTFCHAMVPQMAYSSYPNPHVVDAGNGKRYRLFVEGPGVTPLVMAQIADPGDFDPTDPAKVAQESAAKAALQQISAPTACLKGH